MSTVIKVESLSKKYLLSHQAAERYIALRDIIANGAKKATSRIFHPFAEGSSNGRKEEFWALNGVSFEIKRGDRLGIIGRNGAGKSTLLKVLSRITEPTSGHISIKGRVASLLEVGTGFHPELTGRENIYLNGAILGMHKAEIRRKFDEIVAFAEMEKFLDTPVKRYSSGMYVRLAFAVAAHLEPEILIVDEVLAVGDAQFQKKCLGRMDVIGKEGRTVLFVSHNMGSIKALCSSAIMLSQGNIAKQGEIVEVVNYYLQSFSAERSSSGKISWDDKRTAPGTKEIQLQSIALTREGSSIQSHFNAEDAIKVVIDYTVYEKITGMRMIIQVLNSESIVVFTSTDHSTRSYEIMPGSYSTICTLPPSLFNSGRYSIKIHAGCPGIKVLLEGEEFLDFWIDDSTHHGSTYAEKWPGIVAPKLIWKTQLKKGTGESCDNKSA
jgi:lipopolysaccharide transport system ATP-binding protein